MAGLLREVVVTPEEMPVEDVGMEVVVASYLVQKVNVKAVRIIEVETLVSGSGPRSLCRESWKRIGDEIKLVALSAHLPRIASTHPFPTSIRTYYRGPPPGASLSIWSRFG
jgi:hypothetical protein